MTFSQFVVEMPLVAVRQAVRQAVHHTARYDDPVGSTCRVATRNRSASPVRLALVLAAICVSVTVAGVTPPTDAAPATTSTTTLASVVSWDAFNPTFPSHTGQTPTVYPGQEASFGAHWDYVQNGWLPEDYPTDIYVVAVAHVHDPSTCASASPRFEIGTDPQFPQPNLPRSLKSLGNISIGFYWPTGATKAAAGGSPYYAICLHQRLPKGFAPSPDLLSGTLQDVGSNQVFEVVSDAKPSARLSTTSTRLGGAVTLYGRNWRYYHTYTDVPGTAVHMDFIYQGRTCQPGTCGGEYPVTISANGSFARRVVIPVNWVPGTYLVEVSDAYFGGTGVGDGASPSRKPMYLHIVPSRSTRQARGRLTGRSALGAQTQQTTAKKTVKKGKKPAKRAGKMPTLSLKEFRLRNGAVTSLTRGPDGNLWFTDGNYIGRITPQGKITEFAAPPTPAPFQDQFDPTELMLGPDGNLWYVNTNGNKIGRVTPQGQFTEFALPTVPPNHTAWGAPSHLITGPDGNLWFCEDGSYVGRITPQGQVSEIPLPNNDSADVLLAGKDGYLYYGGLRDIGRIDLKTGAITTFATRAGIWLDGPSGPPPPILINGPDGAIWFGEMDGTIGRLTTSGQLSEYQTPTVAGQAPSGPPPSVGFSGIAFASDGSLWFTRNIMGSKPTDPIPYQVGRLTPQGQFSTFTLPDHYYIPGPLIHGAHGSLWFPMQSGGYMGRITAQHTVQLLRWPSKQTQGPANEMVLGPNGKLWYMANQLFIGEILNS